MANQISVIAPYWLDDVQSWVFDDARVGLVREPFVSGIPEMIDELVADIPNARSGFRLLFSTQPFPGYQRKLTWVRGEMAGNWYRADNSCPALLRYFDEPPAEIYVEAEPLSGGQ
jgi:hypothetical protein